MAKINTCLWFGKDAEAAARFYVGLVPGSSFDHGMRSLGKWPGGDVGDVLLVSFTLAGQSLQG